MTSKDKKETIVAVIFFAAAACILGYYFFGHKSASTPVNSVNTASTSLSLGTAASGGTTVAGSAAGTTSTTSTAFLPNGASLDTSVFNNSVFENLVAPIYPTVSASDVGVQNPFAQK